MRIIDIMVIGLIINFVPYLSDGKSLTSILQLIGALIFFYGFFLVIIYKFLEGYSSKK